METNSSEMELLIKKITNEVINTIMMKTELVQYLMDRNAKIIFNTSKKKQILVLVPDFIINLLQFLEYIVDKHPGYELVIVTLGEIDDLSLPQIVEILNVKEEAKRKKLLKNIDDYFCTYFILPGIKDIEAIVNGDDGVLFVKLIIYNVLHEKTSGIILDYNVENLPSNNLTNKLSKLLNRIETMKISINLLNDKTFVENFACLEKDKLLITERYVKELYSLDIKTIPDERECIITPLARDKMRELGINFV